MNINNLKKVIFDLDGVILSTDEFHFKAWNKAFKETLSIELEPEDKDIIRGVSRPDSLKILLKKYNVNQLDETKFNYLLEIKNDFYLEYLDEINSDAIFDDFENLSNILKKNGIKMVLASSSKNAPYILSKLKIIDLFDGIVDPSTIENLKPSPDIFLEATKVAGENLKSECIVIEDAQSGIDAAHDAEIFVIAFNNSNQKLYNYNVEVKSHDDIINFLNNGQL